MNLHLDDLHYYPFVVSVNKCGSCDTIDGLSGKTCVPNTIEDVNLKVRNMVRRINE